MGTHARQGPAVRGARRGRRAAFTLMELLVIIVIIGLLLGIAAPSVMRARAQVLRTQSIATIRLLDGACKMYRDDCDEFPPSRWSGGMWAGFQGCELLPIALVGYGDLADDGATGDGFRLEPRGRVLGPYAGAENVRTDRSPRVFLDSFKNPIFYYRYDTAASTYHGGDNAGWPGDTPPKPAPSMPDYARRDAGGAFFQTNFVLMSVGPDKEFKAFSVDRTTDDCTNFLAE